MQRQNTSISDGNRKRGKNSEANLPEQDHHDKRQRRHPQPFRAASNSAASDDGPASGAVIAHCAGA